MKRMSQPAWVRSILLLALAAHVLPVFSQFSIVGELRPRTEFRRGFKSLFPAGAQPAFFTEQRARLYFSYRTRALRLQFNFQDVRIWGNTAQIYKSDPALTNVHEAWAEVRLAPNWWVRAGRQELDYDGARFLGNLDWAQQSRVHDALLFRYESEARGLKLHLGAAYNQNVSFEPARLTGNYYGGIDNYKTMQFIWWHRTFEQGKLSLLLHNDGRQTADSAIAFRQTLGTRLVYEPGKLQLQAELYHQTGRDPSNRSVSAWLAALRLSGGQAQKEWTLGADYLSGTPPQADKNRAFAPLYGTNHKFYGFMDYFYVGNPHQQDGRTLGLIDLFAKLAFPAGAKGKLTCFVHAFRSPVAVFDENGREMKPYLGTEVDAVYKRRLADGMAVFYLGYSQMWGTATLARVKGAPHDQWNAWIWSMLAVKPQLFQSKSQKAH